MLNDEGEIVKTKGESIDVPANSWIDIRLAMPESSVWNQHRKQANDAEIQELAAGDELFHSRVQLPPERLPFTCRQ